MTTLGWYFSALLDCSKRALLSQSLRSSITAGIWVVPSKLAVCAPQVDCFASTYGKVTAPKRACRA